MAKLPFNIFKNITNDMVDSAAQSVGVSAAAVLRQLRAIERRAGTAKDYQDGTYDDAYYVDLAASEAAASGTSKRASKQGVDYLDPASCKSYDDFLVKFLAHYSKEWQVNATNDQDVLEDIAYARWRKYEIRTDIQRLREQMGQNVETDAKLTSAIKNLTTENTQWSSAILAAQKGLGILRSERLEREGEVTVPVLHRQEMTQMNEWVKGQREKFVREAKSGVYDTVDKLLVYAKHATGASYDVLDSIIVTAMRLAESPDDYFKKKNQLGKTGKAKM